MTELELSVGRELIGVGGHAETHCPSSEGPASGGRVASSRLQPAWPNATGISAMTIAHFTLFHMHASVIAR